MKKISLIVITLICLFIDVEIVSAETISMGINPSSTKIKPGDIIQVELAVSCSEEVNYVETGIHFDSEIFSLFEEEKIIYREGWKSVGGGTNQILGEYRVNLKADSEDYYITKDMTSNNCKDNINATIVKNIKFKVKNVENQKTKLWVTLNGNKVSYSEINVYQESDNSDLKELKIDGIESSLEFSPDILDYEINVEYNIEKILIVGSCEGINCKVDNLGEKQLAVGKNTFEIVVTAENGNKKVYNIVINKQGASNDTSLSELIIKDSDNNLIPIELEKEKFKYKINVKNNIIFANVKAICSGINCKIEEIETKKLEVGSNIIKIKVIAEDNTEQLYEVIINRDKEDNTKVYMFFGAIGVIFIGMIITIIILIKKSTKESLTKM